MPTPAPGQLVWTDLTVANADAVRDFYSGVIGWRVEPVSMNGGYDDYTMMSPSGTPVAGVCHDRGVNEGLPAQWLLYISVADLDASLAQVEARGGAVVRAATSMGDQGRYAVVRDPAGAVMALFQPA